MLCVGKMGDDPIATWKSNIVQFSENNHFKDVKRIDGMPTEFDWGFPGIMTLGLLKKIHSLMRDIQCKPEDFTDRCNFEARSREILAILPNTVTCSRSLQYTARSLHGESGMYENSRRSSYRRCA